MPDSVSDAYKKYLESRSQTPSTYGQASPKTLKPPNPQPVVTIDRETAKGRLRMAWTALDKAQEENKKLKEAKESFGVVKDWGGSLGEDLAEAKVGQLKVALDRLSQIGAAVTGATSQLEALGNVTKAE